MIDVFLLILVVVDVNVWDKDFVCYWCNVFWEVVNYFVGAIVFFYGGKL